MKISLNFVVRIVGMIALAIMGSQIGQALSNPVPDESQQLATQLLTLAGAGLGLLTAPRFTIDPVRSLLLRLSGVSLGELFVTVAGIFLGLLLGLLLAAPLGYLPVPWGRYLPIAASLLLAYIGSTVMAVNRHEIGDWLLALRRPVMPPPAPPPEAPVALENTPPTPNRYLLDTSAIVDGRIAAVCKTGFIGGVLIVPRFVLIELQELADSGDELRRGKGRRGLELLNQMQQDTTVPVEVVNVDVSGSRRVDDKLVILARQYQCPVITNDFNLKGVAELQGVKVLSINQLADAVRPSVVNGQLMYVLIHKEGRERQQGLAYLEDGTPVVVENARKLIGQNVETVVTRVHQTQTGRIVFAELSASLQRAEP